MLIDLGELEAQIVGTITSSYIGGSLNFVATAEAVGIRDSSIYVASLSADAVGAVIFLLLLMSMPAVRFIRNAMPSKFIGNAHASHNAAAETAPAQAFALPAAAMGLALSLVICAASKLVTAWLEIDSLFILVVTALSLLVANLARPVVAHVSSDFELGTLFMYVFFVITVAAAEAAVGLAIVIAPRCIPSAGWNRMPIGTSMPSSTQPMKGWGPSVMTSAPVTALVAAAVSQ